MMRTIAPMLMMLSTHAAAERLFVATDAQGQIDDAATATLVLAARTELGEVGFGDNRAALEATSAGCPAQDDGCWRRISTLAGIDDTWVLFPASDVGDRAARLVRITATQVETPVLTPGSAGVRSAMQRIAGTHAAIVVTQVPDGSKVQIDGVNISTPIAEGLAPGWHQVRVVRGTATLVEDVLVQGGQVARIAAVLTDSAPPRADPGLDEDVVVPIAPVAKPFPILGAVTIAAGAAAMVGGGVVLLLQTDVSTSTVDRTGTVLGVAAASVGAVIVGVGVGLVVVSLQ
jgi:PEGA domain